MNLNKSVIYEVYPTSFYDKNGDGVGDLAGITEKLDYIKDLGADVIWLNPIFKSPFKDGGYDISDYYSVNEKFGDMDDFAALIKKAHSLGIKILLDLVIGHTSDKHPWFLKSKREIRNEYSDYYIWTNNIFVGGVNTVKGMAKRNGNYTVNYYSFQPALNYGFNIRKKENDGDPWHSDEWKIPYTDERLKPLRKQILDIITFWLDKGADGFRVDLANSLIKGDYDLSALKWLWSKFIGGAKEKYPEAIFMSEWGNPEDSAACGFDIDYFSHCSIGYNELFRGEKGSNILPAFECGHSYFSHEAKGNMSAFVNYTLKTIENLDKGKYYSVPSGYHDVTRVATNKTDEEMKCIFAFLLTYKNLPMIYYGDEIGIKHNFKLNKDGGYIRTGARTPMQWTEGKNKGFSDSDGRLYLPVEKRKGASVEYQKSVDNSLYNFVKRAIAVKKANSALDYDASLEISGGAGYPLKYTREKDGQKVIVYINPSDEEYAISEKIKRVLLAENVTENGGLTLKKQGILVAEI